MSFLENVFIEGSAGAALDSPAGTPNSQALTIQGNASGVPIPISGTITATAPTGTQTVTVAGSVTLAETPTVAITGTVTVAATGTQTIVVAGTSTVEVAGILGTSTVEVAGIVGTSTVTVAGSVSISGTPTVEVAGILGTSTVAIIGTSTVVVSGGTVDIAGTSTVVVSGGTVDIAGTSTVAIAGVSTVNVQGHAGATLDSTVVPGTAPTNGLAVLGQYNTTPPTCTASQTVALQVNAQGALIVQASVAAPTGTQTVTVVGTSTVEVAGILGTSTVTVAGSIAAVVTGTQTVTVAGTSTIQVAGGTVDVAGTSTNVITGIVQVAPTTAANTRTNPFFNEITDGTNVMGTMVAFGSNPGTALALNANVAVQQGTVEVAGIAGTSTVTVAGTVSENPASIFGSATVINTSNGTLNATFNIATNNGNPAILIQLDQTTTITAGAINFQVTYDGTNWVTVAADQVVDPTANFVQITTPYTLQASTNKAFLVVMHGAQGLRIIVTTAMTGTGTITPNYALLAYLPTKDVIIDGTPTIAVTGSISAVVTGTQTVEVAGIVGTPTVEVAGILGTSTVTVAGTVTAACTGTQTVVVAGTSTVEVVGTSTVVVSGVVGTSTVQVAGISAGTVAIAGTSTVQVAGISAGTVAVAGTSTVEVAGIIGTSTVTVAGVTGVITAATAPTSGLAVLSVNNTTPPSLTTGQSVAAQSDYEGSIFVKPIRRSQTASKATTIAASTTATGVMPAQAAGIFADISNLMITPTPAAGAAAGITFTATLSDGTNSYIFDMNTGNDSTATIAGNPGDPINLHFNPPLPATTAATAWTIALSVNTVTVHVTAVAVLQKAS